MPHLSKRKLDNKTRRLLLDAFSSLFSNLNKTKADNLLTTILTDTERLMIAKRIGASLLIREGSTEIEIAQALKLSTATVSKFSLIIRAGDKATWDFILHKLERWQEFIVLKGVLKKAGLAVLKTFSRGMAGKI